MALLRRHSATTERHISMESAIAWSYDLLDEDEQESFRWLSVFGTRFSVRDAEGIFDDPHAEDRVARLVDVSLLQPIDDLGEYRYLEPVRQFAACELRGHGDEHRARLGHARWMANEATRFSVDQWTPSRHEVMEWLFRRRIDLSDAANWAVENDRPDIAVTIVAETGRRLTQAGAAGDLLPAALAGIDHQAVTASAQLAITMAHVAWMLEVQERTAQADEMIERATAIAEATGDLSALGHVMERSAILHSRNGVRDEDLQLIDEAISLLEAADASTLSTAYHNRAVMLVWANKPEDARRSFAAANDRWMRLFGEPLASFLDHQASIRIDEGDPETAVSLLLEAAEAWEVDAAYPQAAGLWWTLADAAYVLGRSDLMAIAVDRHRRLEVLAGVERPPTLDIWNAAMHRRWADVFTAAARWLELRTTRPLSDPGLISDDVELTLFGSTTAPPIIFFVLHPVATALHATGRVDEACKIAREVPGLIAQAPHRHWKLLWELEQWDELSTVCGDQPPIGWSLPEAFARVKQIVLAAASDRR